MSNYRQVTVTELFQKNEKSKAKTVINKGGAGSSKSHSLVQMFIYRLTTRDNYKLLITRKTLPALKISAYKLMIDLLKDYDYYQYCDHNVNLKRTADFASILGLFLLRHYLNINIVNIASI